VRCDDEGSRVEGGSALRVWVRVGVVGSVVALGFTSGGLARAAGGVTASPGFSAAFLQTFPGSCASGGPTGMAVVGTDAFIANGQLIRIRDGGAPETYSSSAVQPWGLAAVGGALYATTPACGQDSGTSCQLVEVNFDSAGRAKRTVGDICATALAADPMTGDLTVYTRDTHVIQDVATGSGARRPPIVTGLAASDPPVSLAWSSSGSTLYVVLRSGRAFTVDRASGDRRDVATGIGAVAAGTAGLGLADHAIVGGGPGAAALQALRPGETGIALADADDHVATMAAAGDVIYVAFADALWSVTGRYTPPAAPPPPPAPKVVPARPAPPPVVVRPVPPPVQPPPPPPPAPPAPPLATAAQFAAQPATVSNVALVPGQEDPEGAMRYAAVVLSLAVAVMVLGGCAGVASRGSLRRRIARAEARSR